MQSAIEELDNLDPMHYMKIFLILVDPGHIYYAVLCYHDSNEQHNIANPSELAWEKWKEDVKFVPEDTTCSRT